MKSAKRDKQMLQYRNKKRMFLFLCPLYILFFIALFDFIRFSEHAEQAKKKSLSEIRYLEKVELRDPITKEEMQRIYNRHLKQIEYEHYFLSRQNIN